MNIICTVALLGITSLFLTQCNATKKYDSQEIMTLSQPAFINSPAHFNTYIAGMESGGTGIEFYIMTEVLPAATILENVYFREGVGKLMRGTDHYVARFRTDSGKNQDIIMSGDSTKEAVNTPPVQHEAFPFPLSNKEAGVTYRDKGVLKYAIISNVKEKESIAYPNQRPRDDGN